MTMISIDSSNISRIGYDAETETLRVEFKSDNVWEYDGVPESAYDAFLAASSKGKFYNSRIKNAGYYGRKIA